MKKTSKLTTPLWFLCCIIALGGCGYTDSLIEVQTIVELNWKQDGSQLFGFIQKFTYNSSTSTTRNEAFDFCSFKSDGSLDKIYPANQQAVNDFSFATYVSTDGNTAITQLGSDLYRITLPSGSYTKLSELFHLLVVSPDLHYVIGSHSPANRRTKTISILDITTSPIQVVKEFDVTDLTATSGIWLSNNTFGLTHQDSAGNNVTIYDLSGTVVKRVGGLSAPFHNSKYIAATNTLYGITRNGNVQADGKVAKINLTTDERLIALADSAENFDVSNDEQYITYTSYRANTDGTINLKLYIRNLATDALSELANDALRYAVFSPSGDRIAYIRKGDQYFNEVRIVTATRP